MHGARAPAVNTRTSLDTIFRGKLLTSHNKWLRSLRRGQAQGAEQDGYCKSRRARHARACNKGAPFRLKLTYTTLCSAALPALEAALCSAPAGTGGEQTSTRSSDDVWGSACVKAGFC